MSGCYQYAHSPFVDDPDLKMSMSGQNSRSNSLANAIHNNNYDSFNAYYTNMNMQSGQDQCYFPPPRSVDLMIINHLNGVDNSQADYSTPNLAINSKKSSIGFSSGHGKSQHGEVSYPVAKSVSQDSLMSVFVDFSDKQMDCKRSSSAELSSDSSKNTSYKILGTHALKNHKVSITLLIYSALYVVKCFQGLAL